MFIDTTELNQGDPSISSQVTTFFAVILILFFIIFLIPNNDLRWVMTAAIMSLVIVQALVIITRLTHQDDPY